MVATTTSRHVHLHVARSRDRRVAANPKLPAAPSDSSQLSSSRLLRRALTDASPKATTNFGPVAGGVIAITATIIVVAACAYLYYRRIRSRLAQREQERAREVSVSLEPVEQPLVLDFSAAARSAGAESAVAGHSQICVDAPSLHPISPTSPITPPSPVLKPTMTLQHRRSMMSFASEKSLFYQPPPQPLQALTSPPIQTPTRAAHSFSISSAMTAPKNPTSSSVSDTSRPTSPLRRSPSSTRPSTTGSRTVRRQHSRATSSNPAQSLTDDQESWGMTVEELLWRCSMIEGSSPPSRSRSQSALELASYQSQTRSRKPSSTLEP
ncbi:hypothetical protein BKA62DRAFT_300495 [Auriculariales sp. MPI-PUGE-AT-0066]|nr:hypothetical protein BKA62DRAFT_300495 [Auriculariales sp. MPI-PUGE-AT-0066]